MRSPAGFSAGAAAASLSCVAVCCITSLAACRRSGAPSSCANRACSDAPIEWQAPVEVARGPAIRGPWRMNDSDYRWVDDPTIDLVPGGDVVVAWVDQARKDVFLERLDHAGRSRQPAPTNVSRSPTTFSWLPRVIVDPSDAARIYVLWQEIIFSGGTHGGDILFAKSDDTGASFSAPLNLSSSMAGDGKGRLDQRRWDNGSLELARGPNGELYAAWTEYEGTLWLRRSLDRGATFMPAIAIADASSERGTKAAAVPARAPSIATFGGAVHIAWAVGDDAAADIHLASSNDRGASFGTPRRVFESEGHSDAPKIQADGTGTLHIVFAESAGRHNAQYHVFYTRIAPGAPEPEPPRRISGAGADASARSPSIAVDGQRRVFVRWEHHDADEPRARAIGFTFSSDGGNRFTAPALVPGIARPELGTNGSLQGSLAPKLASSDDGSLALVNSTFLESRASRVWLLRAKIRDQQ